MVSSPIDIHENPCNFLYVLGVFAAGNLLWLGYLQHISVLPGNSLNLTYNGELYKIIQPLFMACNSHEIIMRSPAEGNEMTEDTTASILGISSELHTSQ